MRKIKELLAIFVLGLMLTSLTSSSAALPSGLIIVVDISHHGSGDVGQNKVTALEGNLTAAGNTFTLLDVNDTFAIAANTDAFLMALEDEFFNAADTKVITDWFNGDGTHLLWVAGDSDFKSFYKHNNTNAILEAVGAKLRFATISVEDPEVNDQAPYRVISNESINDGVVNVKLNEGVDLMVIHSPTAIAALVDGVYVNPLTTEVEGVEVVRATSAAAIGIDSDLSEGELDFYDGQIGNMPLIAIEQIDDGKWVLLTAEGVFTDYKLQYSVVSEYGQDVDGKTFTDNVFSWLASDAESDSLSGFLPLNIAPLAFAFVAIVILRRRK